MSANNSNSNSSSIEHTQTGSSSSTSNRIVWKLNEEPKPDEIEFGPEGPVASTFIPRTIAWMTVEDDNSNDNDNDTSDSSNDTVDVSAAAATVASTRTTTTEIVLLDGYTATCYTPPSIHFAATAIPLQYRTILQKTKKCSLSVATIRDCNTTSTASTSATTNDDDNNNNNIDTSVFYKAWNNGIPKSFPCTELGFECSKMKTDYPSTITHSPIKMHCSLQHYVKFNNSDNETLETESESNENNNTEGMIVLYIENFIIDKTILSKPTSISMIQRNIHAKIDASLIQPIVHLGNGMFQSLVSTIYSMPRPIKVETITTETNSNNDPTPTINNNDKTKIDNSTTSSLRSRWTSTDLIPIVPVVPVVPVVTEDDVNINTINEYKTIEWNWRVDGASCSLGFNPTTALIMPRPIGWISTYTKDGRYKHIAPYSFTIDVNGRSTSTGNSNKQQQNYNRPMIAFSAYRTNNGMTYKDAQKNVEETGVFCCNCVTTDLAVPMNYTAAELERNESEFDLGQIQDTPASYIDAPTVSQSKIIYECIYKQTIDVASFSIVIGEIIAISIDRSIISTTTKRIDPKLLQPLARLGYMDEYGLFY